MMSLLSHCHGEKTKDEIQGFFAQKVKLSEEKKQNNP